MPILGYNRIIVQLGTGLYIEYGLYNSLAYVQLSSSYSLGHKNT
jgi:hypothetical protein